MAQQHLDYLLHLADNALILGQRNAEWCGHGPILEEDLALANMSLDLIGQARMLYEHILKKATQLLLFVPLVNFFQKMQNPLLNY